MAEPIPIRSARPPMAVRFPSGAEQAKARWRCETYGSAHEWRTRPGPGLTVILVCTQCRAERDQ